MLESGNLWKVKTRKNIIGLLNTSKETMEIIYIFIVLNYNMCKEIIRHLACYEIYVWCQPQILFMHLSSKGELISSLDIVSN
jgi:hypothetical protein